MQPYSSTDTAIVAKKEKEFSYTNLDKRRWNNYLLLWIYFILKMIIIHSTDIKF